MNVVQADARFIPCKNATFAVIFMIEVLDHIPQIDSVFLGCHLVLKYDGSMILSFWNRTSLKSTLREMAGNSTCIHTEKL